MLEDAVDDRAGGERLVPRAIAPLALRIIRDIAAFHKDCWASGLVEHCVLLTDPSFTILELQLLNHF